ncbi:MAG TPA: ribosome silencing factor [Candidatus Kapabacteria bacterium]|nr:ribosome silencing factor [Candidatus Kapabacteria bacterium]HPO62553.1 ribosome silencing factor [Candidatus Kapabacteria bacterium]
MSQKRGKPRTAKGLAALCANLADEKIASDILIMDLSHIESSPADYFVMCSSDSDIQCRAIAEHIAVECKQLGVQIPKVEGAENAKWILLDFFDVVVHIMLKDIRKFYKLENLWGDSKFFQLNEEGIPKPIKKKDLFKSTETE